MYRVILRICWLLASLGVAVMQWQLAAAVWHFFVARHNLYPATLTACLLALWVIGAGLSSYWRKFHLGGFILVAMLILSLLASPQFLLIWSAATQQNTVLPAPALRSLLPFLLPLPLGLMAGIWLQERPFAHHVGRRTQQVAPLCTIVGILAVWSVPQPETLGIMCLLLLLPLLLFDIHKVGTAAATTMSVQPALTAPTVLTSPTAPKKANRWFIFMVVTVEVATATVFFAILSPYAAASVQDHNGSILYSIVGQSIALSLSAVLLWTGATADKVKYYSPPRDRSKRGEKEKVALVESRSYVSY